MNATQKVLLAIVLILGIVIFAGEYASKASFTDSGVQIQDQGLPKTDELIQKTKPNEESIPEIKDESIQSPQSPQYRRQIQKPPYQQPPRIYRRGVPQGGRPGVQGGCPGSGGCGPGE